MADRIVVMNGGVIEQVGTPLELYDAPRNLFVAGFIGSPEMNMFSGTVGEGGIVTAEGTVFPVLRGDAGRAVVLGIRPEHFRLDPAGIEARIELVEQTGSETHVVATIAGQRALLALRDRISAGAGETLRVAVMADRAHLFDPETGLRLP